MVDALAERALHQQVDESMESAVPPPVATTSPPADPRPTLADVLSQHDHLRRDRADNDAARSRVETPKPLACDIEWIERQYAAGGDWSFIASRMDQARPYVLPRAKYDMVIETGRTLAKTPLQKIMSSLSGRNHGNDFLEDLYRRYEIGQISKLPGGNLRMKVKSKEACLQLERKKVNILGGVYLFKEFDIHGGKYFIDISNVGSDTDTDLIMQRLFLLGCNPVYDTFREVNLATGITSATWRVYFSSSSCPSALLVNGSVCDQVLFENKLHPAHGKNAPFQSERLPFGFRSQHGIDLGTTDDVFRRLHLQANLASKAVEDAKKRDGQLHHGAQHGKPSAANQLAIIPGNTSADLTAKLLPLGVLARAKNKPTLLLTNGSNDGFVAPPNRKIRNRNAVDFSNMLVKQSEQPLNGIATSNYFLALQTMEAKFELRDLTTDKQYGVRHQVLPLDVKRPDVMKTSTESSFFVEKHHTKIRRAAKASSVLEVAESMLNDENTALLNILPDCLTSADTQVDGVGQLLEHVTNPDHFTMSATTSPLAFNSALSLKMVGNGKEIAEVAQLHAINRVLCAARPKHDTTFSTKWKKNMKTAVPPKRGDIFKMCAAWWTSSDEITELSRATKALGLFELMLMSIAPIIFSNDHWIQYITGQAV
ncbi:hypothetical protein DD238_000673 [Peronospora effusa]|uniref:Uncharacterized protein n=1 Tax=Peronospora effusa TaxID=542832 RepID=A0A3M6VT83_9STRA|nr:hypothetical protein DD238_000673 [Peronospora effusa]